MKKKLVFFLIFISILFSTFITSCSNNKEKEIVYEKIKPKRIIKNNILIVLGKDYYERKDILKYLENEYALGSPDSHVRVLPYSDMVKAAKQPRLRMINEKIEEQKNKLNNKIEKDIKEAAKEIKNSQLHIASTSYNSLIFKKELKYAFKLSETEKEECKKNLTIQEKIVDFKEHFDINLKDILIETNQVLIKKVEEEKDIIRL